MLTTHRSHTDPTSEGDDPAALPLGPLGPRLPDPHTLKPGSYIYLWAPGDEPGADAPVLARVERTTRDVILAQDLCSQVRRKCEVGDAYPAQLRWQWAFVAPPEHATMTMGCPEVLDRAGMSLDERKELLFGAPGTTVRVSTKDGQAYVGVVTALVIDGDEDKVAWVFMQGPTDSRGPIRYKLRFEDISAVIEGGGR